VAKTYQNLLDEAREILQDTDSDGYRYSDTILLNTLNRGLQELGRIRPDAYWITFDTEDIQIPELATGDLGTTFPISMQFFAPLVSFVCAWCEVLDDEFTVDGRAGMLLQSFKSQVLGL
jgi:hypothetical protein